MRRSAMVVTGNNFYRRENEARGVELACQPGNSIGVFDDMKSLPDGVSVLSLPGWRILSGANGAGHHQLVTEQGGFVFRRPVVADSNVVIIQPNICFPGNFQLQFDIVHISTAISTFYMSFIMYTKDILAAANFYEAKLLASSGSYRYGFNVNSPGATTSAATGSASDISKIRLTRSGGSTITYTKYASSSWGSTWSYDMTYLSPVYLAFKFYFPSASDYTEVEMTNFTLNSGLTQILW